MFGCVKTLLLFYQTNFRVNVNAEFLAQGLQDMGPQLLAVVLIAVLRFLEGHVRELAEEIRVLD